MIEKINFPKPVAPSRAEAKRRTSGVAGTSFSSLLDSMDDVSETSALESAPAAAPVVGANIFLGLQEVSEEEIERRRAMKQGKSMIDALEQLRDSLLVGTVSSRTIRQLEQVLGEQRAATLDPRLQSIMNDIEVRAAVELAKLERASTSGNT